MISCVNFHNAEAFSEIYAWKEFTDHKYTNKSMKFENGMMTVKAFVNDTILAGCAVGQIREIESTKVFVLYNLFVSESCREAGVGSAMLAEIEKQCVLSSIFIVEIFATIGESFGTFLFYCITNNYLPENQTFRNKIMMYILDLSSISRGFMNRHFFISEWSEKKLLFEHLQHHYDQFIQPNLCTITLRKNLLQK